jgi:plastocyanin
MASRRRGAGSLPRGAPFGCRSARALALLLLVGAAGCRDWSAVGGDFGMVVATYDLTTRALPDGVVPDATIIVGIDSAHDFTPATVSVTQHGSVTWVWSGGTHSLVSDSMPPAWSATDPQMNGSHGQIFDTAGAFPYHCGVHPAQHGSVIVAP